MITRTHYLCCSPVAGGTRVLTLNIVEPHDLLQKKTLRSPRGGYLGPVVDPECIATKITDKKEAAVSKQKVKNDVAWLLNIWQSIDSAELVKIQNSLHEVGTKGVFPKDFRLVVGAPSRYSGNTEEGGGTK